MGAVPEEKSSDEELSEDDYSSGDEAMAGQADAWMTNIKPLLLCSLCTWLKNSVTIKIESYGEGS